MSTIIAPASGTARAGVIVVRVSGPNSKRLIEVLVNGSCPKPRFAALRSIYHSDKSVIDKALILYFNAPNSFTGEDIAEFHIHGGPSVLSAFMARALETGLVEYAKAGEFSKRAFRNGKMDLTEAEGLADLIEAETEAQRRQAMRLMQGELRDKTNDWRETIIDCLAEAEAYIDFPDEDLPSGISEANRVRISQLLYSLDSHLESSSRAQKIRDGLQVTIIGAPNVGKSSLLNAICKREAAIVSSIAGTTRDIVEVSFILKNNLVSIADTAGLREADDLIEQEGIRRALKKCESSDLILGMATSLEEAKEVSELLRDGDALIWSKADEYESRHSAMNLRRAIEVFEISIRNEADIEKIEGFIAERCVDSNLDNAPLTRVRHIVAITNARNFLAKALETDDDIPEIACENLRLAARELGEVVGVVGLEEIYDRIFSGFCIGK